MRAMTRMKCCFLAVSFAALILACSCQRSAPPPPQPRTEGTPPSADTTTPAPDPSDGAADIVRAYYRAINERRYEDAYRLWVSEGAASGKSLEVFRSGFANTASVEVVLGTPGSIGAAAGSRYIEIPVQIHAVTAEGGQQAFVGAYTLRRSVVDGATPEQRAWRIYSAKIRQSTP